MYDLQKFKQTYITECFELLGDMEDKLLHLSEDNADLEELNAIFRCAHSIKGGSGAFGYDKITSFTHILEALLDSMRDGKVQASRHAIDTLLKAKDIVAKLVEAANEDRQMPDDFGKEVAEELLKISSISGHGIKIVEQKTSAKSAGKQEQAKTVYNISFVPSKKLLATGNEPLLLFRELEKLGSAEVKANSSAIPALEQFEYEDCYLSWEIKLEAACSKSDVEQVFEFVVDEAKIEITEEKNQEEEPVEVKSAEPQEAQKQGKPEAGATGKAQSQVTSIRVDIDKVDRLVNMVGELVITQAMLEAQARFVSVEKYPELIKGIDELSNHTRDLQEAVMSVRMQPVKSIFSRMPRIVHDIAAQLKKDIKLVLIGENTEVDKTVIEQLSDPLTHMIRNSADHGVEKPEARVAKGKPAQGTIKLSAEHKGGKIVIEIIDDGAGINRPKVLEIAKSKGLVAADANLSDSEIDNLIFLPGFSTAEVVSNISGRGVGMDVVRRNIEGMGGSVHIASVPGEGSTFTIVLPLTLAILDGMIVRVAGEHYIIPITNIIETMRPKTQDVKKVADGGEVINVRGEFITVAHLRRIFSIAGAVENPAEALIVLVESGNHKLGLVVDELIGQQQVVIKSLDSNYKMVDGISGATILGDGRVSLILDIAKLHRMSLTDSNKALNAA